MNLLKTIIERLNQRIAVSNIFDKQFGLCELNANGNDKAWVHYIGNAQAEVITNFDSKQGTLFFAKRGKVSVDKTDLYRMVGCKQMYLTTFPLTAYAVVRKSHLPCDSEDAQDWIASRIYKLASGTDPLFKQSIGVIGYEVVPRGYINEIKSLTANYEFACVSVDFDVQVITSSEDGCYDTCATGDIPLPEFQPCTPCLTEVAVDGVTITGNGTEDDPLVAIGGGGGTPLITKDEGTNVSTNTSTLNFTGAGVTASLTSPGVVQVNVPGGSGVTSVSGTAPIASSGGANPNISISQADTTTDGYLSAADYNTFDGKQDVLSAGSDISIVANVVNNTAPDQVVVLTAGTDIAVSGTYPNFTIDNTAPSSGGTVTAVSGTSPIVSSAGNTPDISIPQATAGVDGFLAAADFTTFAAKQDAITLTTTGTSGAATLTGATLNIPQYAGGGGSVFKSVVNTAGYSSTANTVVYTQSVPANTYAAGDILRVIYRTKKTGTTGSQTLRIFVNATADLSGTPILIASFVNAGSPNFLTNQIQRHFAIKSSTNNTEAFVASGLGQFNDFGLQQLFSNSAINWTANRFFVFAIQSNNAIDVNFGSMYLIEKL